LAFGVGTEEAEERLVTAPISRSLPGLLKLVVD
jgi:hypothetical protein